MKGAIVSAAVAALANTASARVHNRHSHELFHVRRQPICEPSCATSWSTFYGEPTLIPNSPVAPEATSEVPPPVTTTAPIAVETEEPSIPIPGAETCSTTGVYSFPATTITLLEPTTVCAPTSTVVPSGTHVIGGVTTVVESPATITVPVAKETTDGEVVTSLVELVTYVCPSSGTYTVEPITTVTVTDEQTVYFPCVSSFEPGTYTRDAVIVTVTKENFVTICPFTGGPTATATPTTVSPPPTKEEPKEKPPTKEEPKEKLPIKVETEEKPPIKAKTEEEPPVEKQPPVETTKDAEKPKETPKNTPSAPTGHLGGGDSKQWAITYTPFTEDTGACKSRQDVFADIKRIKDMGFTTIRVYSTDCDTLPYVGDACEKLGIRMIVGIFVKEAGCAYNGWVKEQVESLAAWGKSGKWNIVDLFVVGNESVFQGLCSAEQLKQLIVTVKPIIQASGFKGPFTTAETVAVWESNANTLCDVVDIAGAQTHAYFDPNTKPEAAGSFVKSQLGNVANACGKRAISLECGWPKKGNCNGVACAGEVEQRVALKSIQDTIGQDVVFFAYGEAHWKEPGKCNCEPWFDAISVFEH